MGPNRNDISINNNIYECVVCCVLCVVEDELR